MEQTFGNGALMCFVYLCVTKRSLAELGMFLYSLRPETASKIGQQRAQGPGTKGTPLEKPWSGTL